MPRKRTRPTRACASAVGESRWNSGRVDWGVEVVRLLKLQHSIARSRNSHESRYRLRSIRLLIDSGSADAGDTISSRCDGVNTRGSEPRGPISPRGSPPTYGLSGGKRHGLW